MTYGCRVLRRTVLASGLAALLAAAGCRADRDPDLRIMVPNAPGSGYDITARAVATALDASEIRRGVEVFNLPGGGGVVGLHRLVSERGNAALTMLMGLGLIGARLTATGAPAFTGVTPVARLVEDPEVIVVTRDSPLLTLADLIAAWTADPQRLRIGGGSSPGGPDHLATMLVAQAMGIAPAKVSYARYDGGGALLAAILAKRVGCAVSSLGEYAAQVDSGQLRVLGVTSAVRAPGLAAPTLREAGVDVEFANWRGLLAPPGLTDADRAALTALVEQLHTAPSWTQATTSHRWSDAYLAGEAFGAFLAAEDARVTRVLLDLGLTPSVTPAG